MNTDTPSPKSKRPSGIVIMAVIAFCVYVTSFGSAVMFDSAPTALIPIAVLTQGTTHLDAFEGYFREPGKPAAYFLRRSKTGTVSSYPIMTGLLAIPVYLVPVAWVAATHDPSIAEWVRFSNVWQKVSASLFAALSVIVFFRVCLALGSPRGIAYWLSVAFAFGSQLWSTASQALWMHGPGILFLLLAVLFAIRHVRAPKAGDALIVGMTCGIALAIRLNNLLLVGPLLLWLLWSQRKFWILSLLPTLTFGVFVAVYNRSTFGTLSGGYGIDFDSPLLSGLAGVLFSPARGLLIYFPLSLVAVAGFCVLLRVPATLKSIYLVFAAFIILSVFLVAKWAMWHGGHCWGPRLLSEIEPFLLLATVPLLSSVSEKPGRPWVHCSFILALTWSVFTQAVGSYFYKRSNWDVLPANVDQHLERLWDPYDNPIGRSLTVACQHYRNKWR